MYIQSRDIPADERVDIHKSETIGNISIASFHIRVCRKACDKDALVEGKGNNRQIRNTTTDIGAGKADMRVKHLTALRSLLEGDGLHDTDEKQRIQDIVTTLTASSPMAEMMVTRRSFPSSKAALISFPRSPSGSLTSSLVVAPS